MISVVIPTYNRAHVLERAVRSVLRQEEPLELIVVDDCSDDGTEALLRGIGDPRLRYERMPERSGACAARNRGIELSRGELIAFQDSDDEWLPGKLACQRQQLEQSGADLVFCAFEKVAPDGTAAVFPPERVAPGRVTYERLLSESLCSTQTILGRRACFEAVRFDPTFPRLQDWELMLRMAQRFDVRYFSDVLVRVHEQPDSISARPEKLLDALHRLRDIHRDAIRRSDLLSAQMAGSLETANRACGVNPWRDYCRAVSPRLSPKTNVTFVLKAVRCLLRGAKS